MAATSQLRTARAILNARSASTPGEGSDMGADCYSADTENGDHIDDPSEDGLFMLLSGLNEAGNTFITITPTDDDPAWHASVTLLP
jgi:hypothetical protein